MSNLPPSKVECSHRPPSCILLHKRIRLLISPTIFSCQDSYSNNMTERPFSYPSQKAVPRPDRKERRHPPSSLTNSKFGRYYARHPNFERDQEEDRMNWKQKFGVGWGYRYGTRFRQEQPIEGRSLNALDLARSTSSASRVTITNSHYRIEMSPFGRIICLETSRTYHSAKVDTLISAEESSWTQSEDELRQMNEVLDFLCL